jgi:demethylmenaquinone methyltransferase / 2-methoxy-6-polyprenyl-1,4-benzoquinol methylase
MLKVQKQYVQALFNGIAHRYDFLNHLLSGGIDLYWRHRAIEHLRNIRPRKILDVATGTADFAIAALRLEPEEVIGVDIADEMLRFGRKKLERRKLNDKISLQTGDALTLPFPPESFDATIVAFGVRNFENLQEGLRGMYRVLRPGGKAVVLEFSRPDSFPFRQIYLFYFQRILPLVGRALSSHRDAYTYLPDTVMNFPVGPEFRAIMEKVGFREFREERLTGGIATVYSAMKSNKEPS